MLTTENLAEMIDLLAETAYGDGSGEGDPQTTIQQILELNDEMRVGIIAMMAYEIGLRGQQLAFAESYIYKLEDTVQSLSEGNA